MERAISASILSADLLHLGDEVRKIEASGADMLRGGAFKPRTSPYSFQGLREEGIRLLEIAKVQNRKLQELGAAFQENAILDVERDYCRTIKEDPTNVHQR